MSSDAPESPQHAVLEFLCSDILLVCAQMLACDTECRAVDRNIVEAVVFICACFIVPRYFRRCVLCCFFSTLFDVLACVVLRGTIEYVLMGFMVLLLTIYSNTCSSSDS